jgi:hypothetical protein
MFDFFVSSPATTIICLAVWSYALMVYFLIITNDFDGDIMVPALNCVVIWIVIGAVPLLGTETKEAFFKITDSMVLVSNAAVTLGFVARYFWKKCNGDKRYAKYREDREALKKREEIVDTAENICGKMQLPTKAKAELGKALKEWKTLNKEIVPVKKLLEQHEAALAKVRALHQEALLHQKSVSDKELQDSYVNTAQGLADQCEELRKLRDEYSRQVNEKNTRIGELLQLFTQAEKDAKAYKEYDAFTANALEVQKELKDTLLKAKKTK